jgi:PKD repeat protein
MINRKKVFIFGKILKSYIMKKQILTLLAAALTSFAFSQSIPNGGFENWNTSTFEDLQFYFTANTENHNGTIPPPNVTKITDAYHGNYAIHLETTVVGVDTFGAYFANGQPGNPPSGGLPYSQKPTGIRFYYKCDIMPGDSGLVIVQFKKSGVTIGSYFYYITGTQSNYTLFQQTFSLTQNPDTLVFAATSCNFMSNLGKIFRPGSMVQIDSVSFTGVASQPTNLNGDFELWQPKTNITLPGWQTYGYSPTGTYRTSDAYSGSYAIEMQTGTQPFGGGGGVQGGEANTGRHSNNGPRGGYPYNKTADTLVFYYKYFPADVSDSAELYVEAYNSGVQINNNIGHASRLAPAFVYTRVEIPMSYSTTPDTLLVWFRSSLWPTQNSFAGSDLKVDNMYLKSQEKPVSEFIMASSGCVGQPVQLTDNSANAATAWSWIMTPAGNIGSSTSQNVQVTYSTPGTKTVKLVASNSFGSGSMVTHTITIYSLPGVSATDTTICSGASITLTASGATNYTWSTGPTTPTIAVSPTVTTNYVVTGEANGCVNTYTASVIVPVTSTPNICMVSSDSASINNIVYWDKTLYTNVDSFIVYRETFSGHYDRIGAVSKDSLSMYIDVNRSIGPANGDPNVSTYRYKLQVLDNCGTYSPLSPYHTSVYFNDQQTGSFTFNTYAVESTTITPVSTFDLLRDDNNTGAWHVVGSAAGTSNIVNDVNYSTYQMTANWRVQENGFTCTPTLRMGHNATQSAIVKSKSNISNNRGMGIAKNSIILGIHPNPSNGVFTVALSVANAVADVYDLTGKKAASFNLQSATSQIDLSNLSNGSYFLNITTDKGVYHEKINKTN